MPEYRIAYEITELRECWIEADSKDEAREKFNNHDDSRMFSADQFVDFISEGIDTIEEVPS